MTSHSLTTWRTLVAAALILVLGILPLGTGTGHAEPAECSDAIDNDADGFIDYAEDPNCVDATDTTEAGECQDGVDNDSDGRIDYGSDPGCAAPEEGSERAECSDFVDGMQPVCRDVAANLTIRYAPRVEVFKGAVSSSMEMCLDQRKVVLKRVRPGRNATLGEDLTNSDGIWRIPWDARRGRYYAVMPRAIRVSEQDQEMRCLLDRSVTVRID